jgi:hypothetical protein
MQEEAGCPLGALNSMPENQTGSLGFRIESAFTLKDLNGLMEHLYGAENLYHSCTCLTLYSVQIILSLLTYIVSRF